MRLRKLPWIAMAMVFATASESSNGETADAIYEIRNYHFEPTHLADYKSWIEKEALPYISQRVDVVGFWIESSDSPEISGEPLDELGSANVTWIIRWESMEARNQERPAVFSTDEWKDIFSRVPGGPESYLRIEARFATSVH